jgi:hypothetical protein
MLRVRPCSRDHFEFSNDYTDNIPLLVSRGNRNVSKHRDSWIKVPRVPLRLGSWSEQEFKKRRPQFMIDRLYSHCFSSPWCVAFLLNTHK